MPWNEPKFDLHQFAGRRWKMSTAETHLSFQDIRSMRVQRHGVKHTRRLETPAWAMNDEALRERVLLYLESRLYLSKGKAVVGDHLTRLKAINEEAKRRLPMMREALERRVRSYNAEAKAGASEDRLRKLEVEVANRDSEICIYERGLPAVVVAVVYNYYRRGWDSTAIANEFGVKPPMVRIWMYRLNSFDKNGIGCRPVIAPENCKRFQWAPEKLKALFMLRARGLTYAQCAKLLNSSSASVAKQWRTAFGDLKVGRPKRGRPRGSKNTVKVPRPYLGKPSTKNFWNEEGIALLNKLHKQGLTYGEIGKHFPDRSLAGLRYAIMRFVLHTR
jgi:hypothetical protein